MSKDYRILVVNPGSTSDEISYFEGAKKMFHKTVRYSPKNLEEFDSKPITAQLSFRSGLLNQTIRDMKVSPDTLDAVIGRGGLLRPIPSGTYRVDDAVLHDLGNGHYGEHASNLGGLLAHSIAAPLQIPAFIADPVVVDEMEMVARFSGMPENPRISILHALNQKRVARLAAERIGKPYEECDMIVMHGGGGISIGAHKHGRVVDVNNALDGEGPFTPQRSGGVPVGGFLKMCLSGKYSPAELKLKVKGRGGLVAYLGTSDLIFLERFLDNQTTPETEQNLLKPGITRERVELCLQAMTYQISKEICSLLAVFNGTIDAFVLTGGITHDRRILTWIRERIEWAAPVLAYPGGDEMGALRDAAARVLDGTEPARNYREEAQGLQRITGGSRT
ncbi:butyrate kinase [bacterium]|nr:butyrate kinase [candidate division CSSED10-310 bacterium]